MTRLFPFNISLAAPAYNESTGIRAVVLGWYEYLKSQSSVNHFEIIVCNDGSSDTTGEILTELASLYPEVRPVQFTKNQGAAAALTAAIAKTQYEWVLLIDSDDQFPIENLTILFDKLRSTKASVVMGVRDKQDHFIGRAGSKASGLICNIMHRSKLRDFNSAFKLVDGVLLRSLALEAKGMNYSTEITSKLLECRVNIVEVDIAHRQRKMGKSHMKLVRGSIDRFLFVCYISLRQVLLKFGILRRPSI